MALLSARSGIVTVRLPRAVVAATEAGYCDAATLEPLATAGQNGLLSHHDICSTCVFSDPGNASGIEAFEKTGTSLWYAASVLIDAFSPDGAASSLLEKLLAQKQGCHVCEVGSGCGAVGLAMHFGLGCSVVLTDKAHMLPLLYLNCGHNAHRKAKQPSMPKFAVLEWGDDDAAARVLSSAPGGGFDLIVGSDVLYDPADHAALLHTLAVLANGRAAASASSPSAAAAAAAAAHVLLAAADHRGPGEATSSTLRTGFLDAAAALGWRWQVLAATHVSGGRASRHARNHGAGSSMSRACPVVLLLGTPPPPPSRSRTSCNPSE